jgi:hypothetical protein
VISDFFRRPGSVAVRLQDCFGGTVRLIHVCGFLCCDMAPLPRSQFVAHGMPLTFVADLNALVAGSPNGGSGAPDTHLFRVENGKLRYVHTLTHLLQANFRGRGNGRVDEAQK